MRVYSTLAATAVLALGAVGLAAPAVQAAAAAPATVVHDGGELWYERPHPASRTV
ncbi:hypothetical protein [Streptomyces sp. KL116D]|uniref:hypothetical protein n=1 Tax=Streptomyces sp. KL116D TaxID=3045152 RepID=UPI003558631D